MTEISDLYGKIKTLCKQWFYDKAESDNKYVIKGDIKGGTNLLSNWTSYSTADVNVIQTNDVYHGSPVLQIDNSEVSIETKYTNASWTIPYNNFTYGDVFTLSFPNDGQ